VEHEPAGLGTLFPKHDRAAVQAYPVAGHDPHAGIVHDLTVDSDRTGKNELIRPAPRTYAGIGKGLVQSHTFCHISPEELFPEQGRAKKGLFVSGTLG
jgi:hypothetical protein